MEIFVYIVVFVFSVIIHEVSHGYVAHLRGDDTAKDLGRITLNPFVHLELFGSIVLPAMFLFIKAPILFGWAKPVPVNYSNLKNPKLDGAIVSFAGPASNILLAMCSGIGIRVISQFPDFSNGFGGSIENFLYVMLNINLVLAVINLIPIPPLDGSKVVAYFLPKKISKSYLSLNPFVCLIILFIVLSSGLAWSILYPIIHFFVTNLSGIIF
ncbi:MAG: site-2 protease family protein [Endomicrobium sp.]|jgi:Zn-dependent protease|uniref:site-2 protease family protein n=1 Tax=Candidatus Endomicrobiellum cubanum TaxID=3242325 RepID=UPI00282B4811|nr:site-2 protease family protein [Endomicrobium sp.]